MNNLYGKISISATALVLPLTIMVGKTLEWWLKSSNPDEVNIAHGLAYLSPLLTTGFVLFGVILAIGVVTAIIGIKKDKDTSISKLALILLGVAALLSLGSALLTARIDKIEEEYTKEQVQKLQFPTFPGQKSD